MLCDTLPRKIARDWGIAVGLTFALEVAGVLPHWTTIAAICALPVLAAVRTYASQHSMEG
ncbi:hypothetical protein [Novosphingobium sp. Leaf2]|uniref:hypothetical protein n=1 Tax=Novosphingobium sp. Leaf2 TaxID=1735670 RepID=UPI0006F2543B|nr:hypothetical protein [Novosphingobium sp. Leaf2]KQM21900.1 hypothetical protein ASE49_00875 [Novosphingobium sp. Leaf2]